MKLSIIIPVYNEQRTLNKVIDKVFNVNLGKLKKEIIIVDDSSTDKSKKIIVRAQKKYPTVIKFYSSVINLGKGAAVRIGLKYSKGDIIITQDADLELDPNEYLKIINPILKGEADVVYGSRFLAKNKQIPIGIRFGNFFLTKLTNLLYGTDISDMETAYKAFKRKVIEGIRLKALDFEIEPEITARIAQRGYKIHEVPVKFKPRKIGKKISYTDGLEAIYTLLKCKIKK